MLACKKCHTELAERSAQQSLSEIEAALLLRLPQIVAHHKATKTGPLCDACWASWQEKEIAQPVPPAITDNRSPAMKQLREACLTLGKAEGQG